MTRKTPLFDHHGSRLLIAILAFGMQMMQPVFGQEIPAEDVRLIDAAAARLPATGTDEDWNLLLSAVHDTPSKSKLKDALRTMDPFPRERLVRELRNPRLAVRLGALELLEEYAGSSFGFDPWRDPVAKLANDQAYAAWMKWAGEDGTLSTTDRELSEEDYRLYIRELLATDRNRSERAMRMLEPHGVAAIAALQSFLATDPQFQPGGLARLKMAQYRLALNVAGNSSASSLAADLTFGNRDQKLAALGALRSAGLAAIPIVREFINEPDPLVRETAVDAIFEAGGARVLSLLQEPLMAEKDPNVILAAVRHLADIKTDESTALLVHFTSMPTEDLVVASIEALNKGGSDDPFSSSSSDIGRAVPDSEKLAAQWIDDTRWRVRTAAIQFIAARKLKDLGPQVITALDDEDTYVRYSAIRAVGSLNLSDAMPKLEEMAKDDPEMLGHVASLAAKLGGSGVKQRFFAGLPERSPAEILSVLDSLGSEEDKDIRGLIANLALHSDLDVSCAALRILASSHMDDSVVRKLLLNVLDEGNMAKVRAIVGKLDFPDSFKRNDRRLSKLEADSRELLNSMQTSTALDGLYNAFLLPNGKSPGMPHQQLAMPDVGAVASEEFISRLIELMGSVKEPDVKFSLALSLLKIGVPESVPQVLEGLAERPVNERKQIAQALYYGKCKEALPLLTALLNDPVAPVREAAAYSALNQQSALLFIQTAFDVLVAPDSHLKPGELYGYSLISCLRRGDSSKLLKGWSRKILAMPDAGDDLMVLAIVMLRDSFTSSDHELLLRLLAHRSQWVRRAAAEAAGHDALSVFNEQLEAIAADTSAMVRGAIPLVFTQESGGNGLVYFSATDQADYTEIDYQHEALPLDADSEDVVRNLAMEDEDAQLRLDAWYALLTQRKQVDMSAFVKLASEIDDKTMRYRLAYFLQKNVSALTPSLQPLLALTDIERISESERAKVFSKLGANNDDAFLSFDSLIELADSTDSATFVEPDPNQTKVVERTKLSVVYFYKEGCDVCERVERYLEEMKSSFPLLEVRKISILSPDGTVFNQALASRMSVDSGKAPSLFAQGGAIIDKDVDQGDIAKLLARTMGLPQDEAWLEFTSEETLAAQVEVEETFESLTLATVISAGLIDGINPCAFATIIFFLSYLQVARRSRREILMVGIAFILAVFLSYFAFGLVLHKMIGAITGLKWARMILDWAFGLMALVLAFLSFRDAAKVKAGKTSDMTLQLPGFIKNRIRGVIRTGARSSRFVIAAFGIGVVVSLLELSCTGQVYAPIIYKIQQGQLDAVVYLLIYNVAFILPLIAIFILAFFGMTSDALVRFQERHTVLVKIALGCVFLLLAFVVLAAPVKEWFINR